MEKFVKIKLSKYKDLLSSEATLSELEYAGVDNWQGIEECNDLYPEISDKDIDVPVLEE